MGRKAVHPGGSGTGRLPKSVRNLRHMPEIFFRKFEKCHAPIEIFTKGKDSKMPRVPRINIENALYYVTSRGDNNEYIFKEGSDYAVYLDLLRKCKSQYKFKLFAFSLVPNHAHLLIELAGETTISQIMHGLNSNYTKYFNAKHNKVGHLFQERYRLVLVEKEPNLLNVTAYIHLNPKALNLVSDIKDYEYSSYPLYMIEEESKNRKTEKQKNGKTDQIEMKAEIREARGPLKGGTYADFLMNVQKEEMERLGKILAKKPVLGSDEFVEKVRAKIESDKEKADKDTAYPAMAKKLILGGALLVLALSVLTVSLYQRNVRIKDSVGKELAKKESELRTNLAKAKETIREDLTEKYKADMVSYSAMQKRLELEKQKTKELEEKVKKQAIKQ